MTSVGYEGTQLIVSPHHFQTCNTYIRSVPSLGLCIMFRRTMPVHAQAYSLVSIQITVVRTVKTTEHPNFDHQNALESYITLDTLEQVIRSWLSWLSWKPWLVTSSSGRGAAAAEGLAPSLVALRAARRLEATQRKAAPVRRTTRKSYAIIYIYIHTYICYNINYMFFFFKKML